MSKQLGKYLATTIATVLLAAIVTHQLTGWARFDGRINRLALDLAQPDGVILTESLARLPRDLLRVPLLRDVLTEDFVFYYEHNEDRLGLSGSLRRIAYEHRLQWNDRIVDWALDAPAEVALWRDAKGAVRHYLIATSRNDLARLIQQVAAAALKDSQLTLATHIRVSNVPVPVLALSFGRDRALLVAAKGNRVVVLSDPGMLMSAANKADPKAEAMIARLLSAETEDQQAYRKAFALPETASGHRIVLSARYLSFGYQHFFPAIDALRFDFGDGRWTTAVRFAQDAQALADNDAASRALPARPAACAWLPVSWPVVEGVAVKAKGAPPPLPRFADAGAVCWYAQTSLHMPLFVATLAAAPDAKTDRALQGLFDWAMQGQPADTGAAANDKPAAGLKRSGIKVWQRRTAAPYGPYRAGSETYYLPTLARKGRLVIFSPDDKLVGRALDTLERRYPSVADGVPHGKDESTLAVFTPKSLAELARHAAFPVLPQGEQTTLRSAAETHLTPRLKALEKYPAFRLVLPGGAAQPGGWREVSWHNLATRP